MITVVISIIWISKALIHINLFTFFTDIQTCISTLIFLLAWPTAFTHLLMIFCDSLAIYLMLLLIARMIILIFLLLWNLSTRCWFNEWHVSFSPASMMMTLFDAFSLSEVKYLGNCLVHCLSELWEHMGLLSAKVYKLGLELKILVWATTAIIHAVKHWMKMLVSSSNLMSSRGVVMWSRLKRLWLEILVLLVIVALLGCLTKLGCVFQLIIWIKAILPNLLLWFLPCLLLSLPFRFSFRYLALDLLILFFLFEPCFLQG